MGRGGRFGKYGEHKRFERLRQIRHSALSLKPLKKLPEKNIPRSKEREKAECKKMEDAACEAIKP